MEHTVTSCWSHWEIERSSDEWWLRVMGLGFISSFGTSCSSRSLIKFLFSFVQSHTHLRWFFSFILSNKDSSSHTHLSFSNECYGLICNQRVTHLTRGSYMSSVSLSFILFFLGFRSALASFSALILSHLCCSADKVKLEKWKWHKAKERTSCCFHFPANT